MTSIAPVLDSAICLVDNGRLYYRGVDTQSLADHADLEGTARLLWESETFHAFDEVGSSAQIQRWLKEVPQGLPPIDRARSLLVAMAAHDIGGLDVSPEAVVRTGARLVPALAAAITGVAPTNAPIHRQLATAWGLNAAGADLIRRCLVLAADHELNTSTYVARCVASTAASPYAVAVAALAALSGPRHGGQASHVEILLKDLVDTPDFMDGLAARLLRDGIPGFGGERIPGFGHPLYPNGDPRAANVLHALSKTKPSNRRNAVLKIARRVSEQIGRKPNFDFALAAVSSALQLPRGASLGIWLIARAVGWIAHAKEQYAIQTLIRPRARYIGVPPLPETRSE